MNPTTTVIVALASGLFGALIGGVINIFISRATRSHELKLKVIENKREDNKKITSLIAEIKVSINRVEINSYLFVHDKINYWRIFYGQELYRNLQARDELRLTQLAEGDAEVLRVTAQLRNRAVAIANGPQEIKEALNKGNDRIHFLNEEIRKLIALLTKLSIISSQDLSDMEDLIVRYQLMNFSFIDFNSIHEKIKNKEDENELNNVIRVEIPQADQQLQIVLKKHTQKILHKIRNTDFRVL